MLFQCPICVPEYPPEALIFIWEHVWWIWKVVKWYLKILIAHCYPSTLDYNFFLVLYHISPLKHHIFFVLFCHFYFSLPVCFLSGWSLHLKQQYPLSVSIYQDTSLFPPCWIWFITSREINFSFISLSLLTVLSVTKFIFFKDSHTADLGSKLTFCLHPAVPL